MRAKDIRAMLERDFGLSPNISGGSGQSRDDPMILTDADPIKAAWAQMLTLRGIGIGRNILWRVLKRTPLTHSAGRLFNRKSVRLEQLKIETASLTETDINSTVENYYFDIGAVSHQGQDFVLPAARGFDDHIQLPFELGWLHYKGAIDYDRIDRTKGKSAAYGAPGIEATFYVYDGGRGDLTREAALDASREELALAAKELKLVHPEAELLKDDTPHRTFWYQLYLIAGKASFVAVTVRRGKFVKIRLSHPYEPFYEEVAADSLSAFSRAIAEDH